jgi:hypothetical protein
MAEQKKVARIVHWLTKLQDAGSDQNEVRKLLNQIRDTKAHPVEKDHFLRALAQQSTVWLHEAMRGKPFSEGEMNALQQQAQQKIELRVRAIQKIIDAAATAEPAPQKKARSAGAGKKARAAAKPAAPSAKKKR